MNKKEFLKHMNWFCDVMDWTPKQNTIGAWFELFEKHTEVRFRKALEYATEEIGQYAIRPYHVLQWLKSNPRQRYVCICFDGSNRDTGCKLCGGKGYTYR